MADACKYRAQMGKLSHDSAGDTSQRCDKAPAQCFSDAGLLNTSQLLDRLSSKGIEIGDRKSAAIRLESLGYTHVVRYVPAHLAMLDSPSFDTLYDDIVSDHRYQAVLLAYTIRFERSFKVHLANVLAQDHGEFAHLDSGLFKDESSWRQFVDGSRSELVQKARKGSRYAARIASMGKQIPIWYALEFSSLGTVSKFYTNLITCEAKKTIASHYGLDTSFIESWLASFSFVRNECAHGGVLYGRELEIQPRSHRLIRQASNRRAFYPTLLLSWLLECDITGLSGQLIDDLAVSLSGPSMRAGIAAPDDWERCITDVTSLSRRNHVVDKEANDA